MVKFLRLTSGRLLNLNHVSDISKENLSITEYSAPFLINFNNCTIPNPGSSSSVFFEEYKSSEERDKRFHDIEKFIFTQAK